MPVTNYDTLHGEIIAEYTDGVQLDYLKDALGSVTAWVDQNCNIVATARYKPFGDILVSTGTLGRFTWVGTLGYRATGLGVANYYVRSRHYANQQGLWNTVDPLWPETSAYIVSSANITTVADPSGLKDTRALLRLLTCKVYKCTFNGGFRHQFICTEGLGSKNCSGGVWPGWNPCKNAARGDDSYGGDCLGLAGKGNDDYQCILISTNCAEARAACNKIAKPKPNYYGTGVCWGYACRVGCATCRAYSRDSVARRDCVCRNCGCAMYSGAKECTGPDWDTHFCGWGNGAK